MKLLQLLAEALQPMTLYHESQHRFDHFKLDNVDPSSFGHGGFHFISDFRLARQYAAGGYVYVADITVSKPLVCGEIGSTGPGLTREKVIALGYDSYMIKEPDYIEMIIFDISQIKLKDIIVGSMYACGDVVEW